MATRDAKEAKEVEKRKRATEARVQEVLEAKIEQEKNRLQQIMLQELEIEKQRLRQEFQTSAAASDEPMGSED